LTKPVGERRETVGGRIVQAGRGFWQSMEERASYSTSFESGFAVEEALSVLRAQTRKEPAWRLWPRNDFVGQVEERGFVLHPSRHGGARFLRPKAEGRLEEVEEGRTRVVLRVSWAGEVLQSAYGVLLGLPVSIGFLRIGQWPPALIVIAVCTVATLDLFRPPRAARRLEEALRKRLGAK